MTTTQIRPAAEHDASCKGARWLHHMPWQEGAPVLSVCVGCTAVRRIDGHQIRIVSDGPALRGGR